MYKKKQSKKPSDYKTLRIRVPFEFEIETIMKKASKVRTKLNGKLSEDDRKWMKNHVLLKALELGLENMIKDQNT